MGGSRDVLKETERDTEQDLLGGDFDGGLRHKLSRWWKSSRLAVFTVLLLLSSVGNSLFFKRMTSAMPNYCWYLTQLSTVFYLPLFGILSGTGIASQAQPKALVRFMMMGIFDGSAGVLTVLGGSRTSGNMQVLLQQGVIPCSLFFSFIFLRSRFHILQHFGALVIVLGIVLASMYQKRDSESTENDPIFLAIFCLATVPMALSSVFKEVAFRGFGGDLDVNVVQFWTAVFQAVINFASMPIYSLDVLGTEQVPMQQMPALTSHGTQCLFLLKDHVVTDCGDIGQRPCDHCQDAWMQVVGYFFFNLLFNIFSILVIKHGSATLSFLVATLRMPLSSLAFSSTLLMGKDAVQPTFSDFVTLIVIIGGLICYRVGAHLLKRRLEREKSPALTSPSTWLLSPNGAGAKDGLSRRASWRFVPFLLTGPVPNPQPVFLYIPESTPQPRSKDRIRSDLYRRLGAASPLHSPTLRGRSPTSPSSPRSEQSGSPPDSPKRFLSRSSPKAAALPPPEGDRMVSHAESSGSPAGDCSVFEAGADEYVAMEADFSLSGFDKQGSR